MSTSIETELAGVELRLLADRGVYLPRHAMLLIADTHFGKEATFRRHGIPVPSGSTEGTLDTITRMLVGTGASELVILGDMFHARSSLSKAVIESIEKFVQKHSEIRLTLVRGNHDAHVGALPASWPIEVIEPGTQRDGLAFGHHPTDVPVGATLLFCGHLHPSIRVGGRNDRVGRLPCFWWSQDRLVLPAIGEFTGTHSVNPTPADRVWIIAETEVIEYHAMGLNRS